MTDETLLASSMTWDDLPEQPWPEATEPPAEALVDWLLSLDREQLVWVLDRQRHNWRKDSDCFMRNHEGEIRRLQERLLSVQTVLQLHGIEVHGVGSPNSSAVRTPEPERCPVHGIALSGGDQCAQCFLNPAQTTTQSSVARETP